MNINFNQLAMSNPKTFAFGVGGLIVSTISLGGLAIYGLYKLVDKHGAKVSYKGLNAEIQINKGNDDIKALANEISNELEEQ